MVIPFVKEYNLNLFALKNFDTSLASVKAFKDLIRLQRYNVVIEMVKTGLKITFHFGPALVAGYRNSVREHVYY